MARGHMPRHSGSPTRHSGASRNLWRVAISPVIPAQAGTDGVRPYAPSFRRKPEPMACGHKPRHSGASRNLWRVAISPVIPDPPAVIPAKAGIYGVRPYPPSFRRQPESMACGHTPRHSGASRNLWRVAISPVIPAPAGIYGAWPYAQSFRRQPESMACSHKPRHSGASRNLWPAAISPVIPAPAGIYGAWS